MKTEFDILLVEDSENVVKVIGDLLEGQTVITANIKNCTTLGNAIEVLANTSFDTLLLNLNLPDSEGIETFTKLTQQFPNLPSTVILIDSNDKEIGNKTLSQCSCDYIIKDQINPENLWRSVVSSYECFSLKKEVKVHFEARKLAENNAGRMTRLLRVLSKVNQAIVRINDKATLREKVFQSLLRTGDIFLVIADFINNPGLNGMGCHDNLNRCINNETVSFFKQLQQEVISSGRYKIMNNFHRVISGIDTEEDFKKRAGSCAVFPLRNGEDLIGTMAIVSETESYFDWDEVNLMKEIADDLAFAFSIIDKFEEKSQVDDELRLNKISAESLYTLSQNASLSENELIDLALEMSENVTASKISFLEVTDFGQERLDHLTWPRTNRRNFPGADQYHHPESSRIIWSDLALKREEGTELKGNPELDERCGEITGLKRCMTLKVYDDNQVVLIARVGNKEKPYADSDSNRLLILMNEIWKLILKNRITSELDLSRKKLNLIASRTGAVMYQLGANGHDFEYIHPAVENLTGYNPSEIKDRNFETIIRKIERVGGHPVDIERLPGLIKEKIRNEYTMDYLIEMKSGELKWLNDKSYPWLNEKDEVVGSIGILMDISNKKEAEIEVISQKNKSEQLFYSSPVAIARLDTDANILNTNSSFERLFGYSLTEVIGENLDKLIVPAEYMEEALTFNKETTNGLMVSEISTRKKKDGSIVFVATSGIPINVNGENIGFYAMYTDLTTLKLTEEALIKARNRAEESDRLKTAFLRNISHEIRTPMNSIVGFSSLLGDPDLSVEKRQSFVDRIITSSNHLLSKINDIVETSHIDADMVDISWNIVCPDSLLQDISKEFLMKAKEKNLEMILKTPGQSPNGHIITDSSKLSHIMSNLVNNAIKFTEKGKIEFGYAVKENTLEFFVSDTGIGIPEEKQPKVFDKFYQVDSSLNRQYEGTGLGLSIAKAYVELLGGKIRLNSLPGSGSVFYFTIPDRNIPVSLKTLLY
jgi:PAS domain S-box-containing protein